MRSSMKFNGRSNPANNIYYKFVVNHHLQLCNNEQKAKTQTDVFIKVK